MKHLFLSALLVLFYLYGCAQQFDENGIMKVTQMAVDKSYGYTAAKKLSVKVGGIKNEEAYMAALAGPHGENIMAVRKGICCAFKSRMAALGEGFLDRWEITWPGLKEPLVLYLNAYDYAEPKCPVGLTIKHAATN